MSEEPQPWKTAPLIKDFWDPTILFNALRDSAQRYIRFKDPSHYDVLASWARATWLIDKWRAFGPLYLLGDIGSGKTTVLEWLEEVCYRGIRGGSMSVSVMFHLSHTYCPTLLIDETQLYNKDDYAETQALINESYRKGGKVWRMTGEGRNMKPQFFNAYGPRAFAASKPPWDALSDRALTINMESTDDELEETMSPQFYEEGEKLRSQLEGFRDFFLLQPQDPEATKALSEIRNHRVREIAYPILSYVSEPIRLSILGYVKKLEQRHLTRKRTGSAAEYIRVLLGIEPDRGKVSAKTIRANLATDWGVPLEKAPSERTIMAELETLDFERTAMDHGRAGIIYEPLHLEEMRKRYCPSVSSPKLTILTLESENREEERGKVRIGEDTNIACEYCHQPFNTHKEYERHRCPIGAGYPE